MLAKSPALHWNMQNDRRTAVSLFLNCFLSFWPLCSLQGLWVICSPRWDLIAFGCRAPQGESWRLYRIPIWGGTKTLYTFTSRVCVVDSDFTNNCQIINPAPERDRENQAKLGVCILTWINHKDKMLSSSLLFSSPSLSCSEASSCLYVATLPPFLSVQISMFISFISHDISLKPNTILYITPLHNNNTMRLQSLIEHCPFTQ